MTELITLPLTGLEVPHTRYHLDDFEQMTTRNGIAFRATVNEGDYCLGVIENGGNGGGTWFFQHTAKDRQAMEEFTDACRLNGRPISAERVYELLVDQHDLAQEAARCKRQRTSLLRGLDGGEWHGLTVVAKVPSVWLARGDYPYMGHLARDLAQHRPAPEVWQVWDGEQWKNLTLPAITGDAA